MRNSNVITIALFLALVLFISVPRPADYLGKMDVAAATSAAEDGDLTSQSALAYLYFYGRDGIRTNKEKFLKWAHIAAEKGDARAQLLLGYYYMNNVHDYEEGLKWARKSAEQGFPRGQRFLGYLYSNGIGLPRDDELAFKWWYSAAIHGDWGSRHNVALSYMKGWGVERDFWQGTYWMLSSYLGYTDVQGLQVETETPPTRVDEPLLEIE